MKYRSRPRVEGKKVDFSGFHPLDHLLYQCRNYPGGWRTHLKYRWQFQWRSAIYSKTKCLVGWHHPGQAWSKNETWVICTDCGDPLSEKQPE